MISRASQTAFTVELPFWKPSEMEVFANPEFSSVKEWLLENTKQHQYHRPTLDLSDYANLDKKIEDMKKNSQNKTMGEFTRALIKDDEKSIDNSLIDALKVEIGLTVMVHDTSPSGTASIMKIHPNKMEGVALTVKHNMIQYFGTTKKDYFQVALMESESKEFNNVLVDNWQDRWLITLRIVPDRYQLHVVTREAASDDCKCYFMGCDETRQWHISREICIVKGKMSASSDYSNSTEKDLASMADAKPCPFMASQTFNALYPQLDKNSQMTSKFNWVNDFDNSEYNKFVATNYQTQLKEKKLPLLFMITFSFTVTAMDYFNRPMRKSIYIGHGIATKNNFIYYNIDSVPGNSGSKIYTIENGKLYCIGLHIGGLKNLNIGYLFDKNAINTMTTLVDSDNDHGIDKNSVTSFGKDERLNARVKFKQYQKQKSKSNHDEKPPA